MAEAYSIFANGGYHVLPYFISRIDGADGQPIYVADPPKACSDCWFHDAEAKGKTGSDSQAKTEPAKTEPLSPLPKAEPSQAEQVIDPRIAYQINSMLRGVVEHGTATRALSLGRPDIVGKTGTTNDVRDSWFCGYQASMVTVAWMGFDAFHKLGRGEEGGHAALGMWNDFMKGALKGVPVAQLDPPPGMVSVKIGGTTEEVMEEYQLMAMGPEGDQLVARSKARSKPKEAKPSAPRVVEDLF